MTIRKIASNVLNVALTLYRASVNREVRIC